MKILDATCGYRSFWFNKKQLDTIFIDIRPEVKPDVVMDCTKTDFPAGNFDLIVFDPPHQPYTKAAKGIFAEKYGRFRAFEIRKLIAAAFREFYRILKDDGFVIFKWNTHSIKLSDVILLVNNFEFLFGQKTTMRTKHSSITYWFCLKKKIKIIQKELKCQ